MAALDIGYEPNRIPLITEEGFPAEQSISPSLSLFTAMRA